MVEVIRRSTVVPDRVLELSKVVECGDLFQVDLKHNQHVRMYKQHARSTAVIAVTFFFSFV